jgi:AAA domain
MTDVLREEQQPEDAGPPDYFADETPLEPNPVDLNGLFDEETPRANANGQEYAAGFRPLASVEMRSIEWLDKPLFQRAAFQLVAGKKGAGKGTYVAGLSARVSRGEVFDRPMNVLLIASEDSDEIDIKPRVRAADGDEDRIYTRTTPFLLPRDVGALEAAAREIGDVGLIIIDPVGNHIGGANTDAEGLVRDAINPLNGLANTLGCLILGVRHLSKDTSRGALASVLGSTAWVDVPRAVLAVAADDEEDMLFHIGVVAGNRSARGQARSFRIELADVGLKETVTRAVDLGISSKSVETLLSEAAEQRGRAVKREGAEEIILRELAIEPRPLDHLKAVCASEIGSAGDTVYRAANALKAKRKVCCSNSGPGTPWLWRLTLVSDDDDTESQP